MLQKIQTALTETTIAQLAITILCLGASVYLTVTSQTVPDWLLQVDLLVIGFYFGSITKR